MFVALMSVVFFDDRGYYGMIMQMGGMYLCVVDSHRHRR